MECRTRDKGRHPIKPADAGDRPIRRGPITYRFNGRGPRPWLPETTTEPGWVYLVGLSPRRRLCNRCTVQVSALGEGKVPVFWEEEPSAEGERCPRCLRSYAVRMGT